MAEKVGLPRFECHLELRRPGCLKQSPPAVNGFGFLQLIRRRTRASLPELIAADRAAAEARALLRRIERSQPPHPADWPASPEMLAAFARRPDWLTEAERRTGRPITLAPAKMIGENAP